MAVRINRSKFRRLLAERGYSPTRFAEAVNMGTRTLAAILAGREVNVQTVEKVAEFAKAHPVREDLVELLDEPEAAVG